MRDDPPRILIPRARTRRSGNHGPPPDDRRRRPAVLDLRRFVPWQVVRRSWGSSEAGSTASRCGVRGARGLAKALCSASSSRARGLDEAWLGVDGTNPTGALQRASASWSPGRWQAYGRRHGRRQLRGGCGRDDGGRDAEGRRRGERARDRKPAVARRALGPARPWRDGVDARQCPCRRPVSRSAWLSFAVSFVSWPAAAARRRPRAAAEATMTDFTLTSTAFDSAASSRRASRVTATTLPACYLSGAPDGVTSLRAGRRRPRRQRLPPLGHPRTSCTKRRAALGLL